MIFFRTYLVVRFKNILYLCPQNKQIERSNEDEHSAAATHNYTFIWGMGGENLDYGDQDFYEITDLK